MRLQLPGNTSPSQMTRWEVEYQPSGKLEAGLQLPEASAARAAGGKMEPENGEFRYRTLTGASRGRFR